MAVESGKTGKIVIGSSDIREVRNWKFDRSGNVKSYASSSTLGYQRTVEGMFAGTVSFDVVLEPDTPIEGEIGVGDLVTANLYRNATKFFIVPCRIESIGDEVNIEEGEPPTVSVEAITHGAWTDPT